MTDTASAVVTDKKYQIHRHAMIEHPEAAMPMIRFAAERAVQACLDERRTPVMVEVIVYVAPREAGSE